MKSYWASIRSLDPWLVTAIGIGAYLRFNRVGDFDNPYYTATVASMLQSVHNFVFASSDPAGVVMVDKPPVAFWIQAVSGAVLGVSQWSVSVPQAIVGTFAILVLYAVIRPVFGRLAALVSAFTLAVIPASVIIDSGNEPDSLLSFILLLAAFSLTRAVHTSKGRWLVAFAILIGIGFNVKMFVAFIPLPIFFLYYATTAKHPFRHLVARIAATGALLSLISVSWITIIAITPPEHRPYVGSTPDNSIHTLVFHYNGINRFTSFIGPRLQQPALQQTLQPYPSPGPMNGITSTGFNPPQFSQSPSFSTQRPDGGLFGLFSNPLSSQLGWLLPTGLIALAFVLVPALTDEVFRRPTRIIRVLRNSPSASQGVLWGGWLITGLLVFGLANSTTTHPYYLVGVAVPIAATIGIGWSILNRIFRDGSSLSWLVLAVPAVTVIYQVINSDMSVSAWVIALSISIVLLSSLILAVGAAKKLQNQSLARVALVVGISAMLLIPMVTSMTTGGRIAGPNLRVSPSPQVALIPQAKSRSAIVVQFLGGRNYIDSGILLGTLNSREAAPLIISGVPSIAIGGFSGNDPIFSLDSFLHLAQNQGLRYFLMPSDRPGRSPMGRVQEPIMAYIRAHWDDVSHKAGLSSGSLFARPVRQRIQG